MESRPQNPEFRINPENFHLRKQKMLSSVDEVKDTMSLS